MFNTLKKLRAAPYIAYYRLRGRPGRDYRGQWEGFWSSASEGGQVLWDSDDAPELDRAVRRIAAHADASLPILDLGCGNGTRSAALARHFEPVIGVDVSEAAVELASRTHAGNERLKFQRLDLTDVDAAQRMSDHHGDLNVHLRGVLHLIAEADRDAAVQSLRYLLSDRGTLYFVETDGTALEYFLGKPGNSPSGLPAGMHEVIRHGILPSGFDADSHRRWFDPADWETLEAGHERITTVPFVDGEVGQVPAYYAVLRARTRPAHDFTRR